MGVGCEGGWEVDRAGGELDPVGGGIEESVSYVGADEAAIDRLSMNSWKQGKEWYAYPPPPRITILSISVADECA